MKWCLSHHPHSKHTVKTARGECELALCTTRTHANALNAVRVRINNLVRFSSCTLTHFQPEIKLRANAAKPELNCDLDSSETVLVFRVSPPHISVLNPHLRSSLNSISVGRQSYPPATTSSSDKNAMSALGASPLGARHIS